MRCQHNQFEIFLSYWCPSSLFIFYCWIIFHGLNRGINFYIHVLSDSHLDYFQFLAVTNKAAINIHLHIFFYVHMFLFLWGKYLGLEGLGYLVVVVQLLSHVRLLLAPWTAAHQASLSFTVSWSLLKPMSIELVMPFNHLILCHPLLPPSIFPSIRVFSNE